MPFNKMLKYPILLSLEAYSPKQRHETLLHIYERDIFNNKELKFRSSEIRPTKSKDCVNTKETHFKHLTHKKSLEDTGVEKRDSYDPHRSKRLHWVKYHIQESEPKLLKVFNYIDRINGQNYLRTYIYDEKEKYVIILEPKRDGTDCLYLITAYYFDQKHEEKKIIQKYKKRV